MKQTFEFFGQAAKEADRLKKRARYEDHFLVTATTQDFHTSQYEVQAFTYPVRDAIKASGGQVLLVV